MDSLFLLKRGLNAAGVPIVSIESDWLSAMNYPDTVVMGEAALNPFAMRPYRFSPTFLRWKYENGERRLMWIEPGIDRFGRYPRRDWLKEGQIFFSAIMNDWREWEEKNQ